MNILFVGDPHLDSQTPLSRIDDYRDTTIRKLDSLLDVALKEKVDIIVFSGDIFDKLDQSVPYLIQVSKALKKFKDNSIELFTVIGNHDLPYNNMDYFTRSPLYLLISSGLIKHLKKEAFNEVGLYGIDFTKIRLLDSLEPSYGLNILVMHYATDNTVPGDSISRDKLSKFDLVLSGHDHTFYPTVTTNLDQTRDPVVLRPGSFTRRTKEKLNLSRGIYMYKLDTKTKDISLIELPNVEPADRVFSNTAFTSTSLDLYKNKYNDLFNEDYFKSKSFDVYKMIDSLPPTVMKESKQYLIKRLKEFGINES